MADRGGDSRVKDRWLMARQQGNGLRNVSKETGCGMLTGCLRKSGQQGPNFEHKCPPCPAATCLRSGMSDPWTMLLTSCLWAICIGRGRT